MIENSTDLLLGAIAISVVGVSAFICYLLCALAKVVQESKKTVEDVNKKLEKIDPVVDSTSNTVSSLMQTIDSINNGILKPVASFSQVIKNVRSAAKVFTGKKK